MKTTWPGKQTLNLLLCLLPAVVPKAMRAVDDQMPLEAEQRRMVEAMAGYAVKYTSGLPNFICQQTTVQFQAGKNGKHWHQGDALTSRLVFSQGKEQRTLELVNNKQIRPNRPPPRTPFSSAGEFGILLYDIFDENAQAKFSWGGWDIVRGRRVARFDYAIDVEHSMLQLTNYITKNVAFHGSVYGDPDSGAIWRATSAADNLPEELQMNSVVTTMEYNEVQIGGQSYLLPVSGTVLLKTDRDQIRNELSFVGYRKFGAESTITFGPPARTPSAPPQ